MRVYETLRAICYNPPLVGDKLLGASTYCETRLLVTMYFVEFQPFLKCLV